MREPGPKAEPAGAFMGWISFLFPNQLNQST